MCVPSRTLDLKSLLSDIWPGTRHPRYYWLNAVSDRYTVKWQEKHTLLLLIPAAACIRLRFELVE